MTICIECKHHRTLVGNEGVVLVHLCDAYRSDEYRNPVTGEQHGGEMLNCGDLNTGNCFRYEKNAS